MKKLSPQELKGKKAEERFIALARSLRVNGEKIWIGKVKKTRPRLDAAGIDVTIYITRSDGQSTKVPFQIKSSPHHIGVFAKHHPECVAFGVPIVIVNGRHPDEAILYRIKQELENIRQTGKDFELLYDAVRSRYREIVQGPRTRIESYRRDVLERVRRQEINKGE